MVGGAQSYRGINSHRSHPAAILFLCLFTAQAGFLALARLRRAVAGYAMVCIEEGPDDTFPVAELYSLSVDPELRGRGISIYDLKVAGMTANAGALRLYERRGLREAEVVMYRFGLRSR